jgi:hypothetical protein
LNFPDHRSLLGVISGMIVWAAWFAIVYGLTGLGCDAHWHLRRVPVAGNLLSLVMLLSTALALFLIGWTAWRGFRGWRGSATAGRSGAEKRERQNFMGLSMFVLSLLAAAATVMVAIPILMLDPCAT